MACPRCGKDARFEPTNPWRPFCSERCRLIDAGNWAAEKYRLPEPEQPDNDESVPPRDTA